MEVNNDNYSQTLNFLNEVKALNDIEDDVVNKATIIMDKGEVMGSISYEKFGKYGLIRYFIFRKCVDDKLIDQLFNRLVSKAKDDEIDYLFSIIMENNVIELFKKFSFTKMDKNLFFIEEERLSDTKYKNATIMVKKMAF